MPKRSSIRFYPIIFWISAFFVLGWSNSAWAQSEQDLPIIESTTPAKDRQAITFPDPSIQDGMQESRPSAPKRKEKDPDTVKIKTAVDKKDSIVVSEEKKPENPSTLSFNIFLYVLERFKADEQLMGT